MMQHDDPPFLTVGTEVSAKYKGAFCEAKVNKVVKNVKVKVTFKYGMGSAVVSDDNIEGTVKVGAQVKALHSEKNQHLDAIINKIQDCSQYTVVFDDGDITTLRRSSLCLKSGRHFAESETLDQLPLTHPEHFGTPVVGGRRGRRSRNTPGSGESSEEEENVHKKHQSRREEWEADMGKVVCVEIGDKKKQKDNWFPGLVVAPTAQDTVKIETKKDYLVRSFQDGRYYTVPKKEALSFNREVGAKVSQSGLRPAVDKALLYIDKDELPPHWDRDLLFGVDLYDSDMDRDSDSDSSDDEPREEKDHFVAQLYKYMEECGTPINKGPTLGNKDLDLHKLFKVVQKLGGFNRVMNQNQWKVVSAKMGLNTLGSQASNLVKAAYKRYLQSFDDFYRKLGCTMVSNPRGSRMRHRSGRSLIRDCDKNPRPLKRKGTESCDSTEDEGDKDKKEEEEDDRKKEDKRKEETKKEDSKRAETPTRKETRKRDCDVAESDKKETRRKDNDSADLEKKEARKKEIESAKHDKIEIRKKENEISEAGKKSHEKKKDEVKIQRNRTPPVISSRTNSPTTRERLREMKILKCEIKPRALKKELKEEELKSLPTASKEEIKEENDSDEEFFEMAKTRSLRNREEKEKEKEPATKIREEREREQRCKEEKDRELLRINEEREKELEKEKETLRIKEKERESLRNKEKEKETLRLKEKEKELLRIKEEKEEREFVRNRDEKERELIRNREEKKVSELLRNKEERDKELLRNKEEKERELSQNKEDKDLSRNREDKERDAEQLKKSGEQKLKLDHHQRSTSCNSTSSGTSTSSSTCTSSSTSNLTDGKSFKQKLQLSKSLYQLDELRKRGRRKRIEEDFEFPAGKSTLPAHVPITIGDKLRVLYGPNNKESKITYEAKVLEIEEEGSQKMYYVHYLGWNSRYDEWVVRQRVAQNLSWGQSRNKKGRTSAAKEHDRKKEGKDEKDDKKECSREGENLSLSTRSHGMSSLRRGRPVHCTRRESEKAESRSPSQKATTRSESANQTSTGIPISDKSDRRRSRRNASASTRDTEDSESDDFESGAECSSERGRVRRESNGHIPSSVSTSPGNASPEPMNNETFHEIHKSDNLKTNSFLKESLSPHHNSFSCGKDIDLKAIESEMKGLDRPIKKEDGISLMPKEISLGLCGSTGILTTVIPGSLTITEKKKHDPSRPNDSPAKRVEIPVRLVPAQEIMGHIKPLPISGMKKEPLFEDDIYEFKEPEPFEFGEIRSRKENKVRSSGSEDLTEPEAKVKKKGKPKKDSDDKSGSESDCSISPQKRTSLTTENKESPSPWKSENKESPMKKENKEVMGIVELKKDYSRRFDMKDQIKIEDKSLDCKEYEMDSKILSDPCRLSPVFKIKIPDSSIESGEKPLLIDLFRDSGKPTSRPAQIDLKDLKLENIDGKELHMIGSSVVVTPKKFVVKKEPMNTECSLDSIQAKPLESEILLSLKHPNVEKCDEIPRLQNASLPGGIVDVVDTSKPIAVMTRIQAQSSHVLAQVVVPSAESKVVAKIPAKSVIDLKTEIGSVAHLEIDLPPGTTSKLDEKSDRKMLPFSQRQQHIFPHLLKRSDFFDDKGVDNVIPTAVVPPSASKNIIISPSSSVEASCSGIQKSPGSAEEDKINEKGRTESTVEESIEAVVSRARQELIQLKDKVEKKTEIKSQDKRRRNPGRSKKALSREFLPDSSEESECDKKGDKSDHIGPRQKRFKGGDGLSKYSPSKRTFRGTTEVDKTHVRRCDEEERANDADEEDNECNFPPLKILSKEADKRRKELEVENMVSNEGHEKESLKIGLLKKRRRSSATLKRSEENEETGLGDLLCEETIPPGSPMTQDHLTIDTDPPVPTSTIKQEMPFASVPTGSSFSKRGTSVTTIPSSQSSAGHLQASLQQIHSSVCIQSIHQSSISQPYSTPPTVQPNVTITSIRPISHSIPLNTNKTLTLIPLPSKSPDVKIAVPSVAHATQPICKAVVSKVLTVAESKPLLPSGSDINTQKINPSNNSVVIIPTSRPLALNPDRVEERHPMIHSPLANIDNTPPTTPESIISTMSDSPRQENEASSKMEDNSTKSGLYSSEMEFDKIDNLSEEDSNTMDSNSCPSKTNITKRPATTATPACTQSHSEGWDTEDGNQTVPKRHKKGSKVLCTSAEHDKEHNKSNHSFSASFSCSSGSRRKRLHSTSRGTIVKDEDHDFHGVSLLSAAASHMSGRSRYNFCQELDPQLDASKRITVLQTRMQDLKRTYMQVKAELASVERRRKKLRKKEREKESQIEAN